MHTFHFEFLVKQPEGFDVYGDSFDNLAEKVCVATDPLGEGTDCTFCMSNGQLSVMFSREAPSRTDAVSSARAQLASIGLEVTGVEDFTL